MREYDADTYFSRPPFIHWVIVFNNMKIFVSKWTKMDLGEPVGHTFDALGEVQPLKLFLVSDGYRSCVWGLLKGIEMLVNQ